MQLRSSRNTRKQLIVFALMLMSLASWLALPGNTQSNAARVFADVSSPSASLAKPDKTTQARWSETYGKLPRSFEANQGQFDSRVRFVSRGAGQTVYLTATQAVFFVHSGKEPPRNQHDAPDQQQTKTASARQAIIRMRLVGANAHARVEGLDELRGKSNYLIGNDPKRWHVNVPDYAKVKYERVYRGVDLICYGNNRRLEYDLIVAAGADPRRIKLAFDGVQQMHIDHRGDLVLVTPLGEMRQHRPIAYQETNGRKVKIAARYVMGRRHQIGFKLGRYDSNRPLVIDPVLSYSSYLGGADQDIANAIAVDPSGNAYVTGQTYSLDFPTTPGALQTVLGGVGSGDAFVTKIDASGTALLYSTYIGGDGDDSGQGIAVDSSGNAYVTGQGGLAETPGAYGPGVIFVTKLNATGSAIIFTSRLGGETTLVSGIAVDNSGAAYVTGYSNSSTFPTTPGAFQSNTGCCGFTAFITKFNPTGSSLVYSTYLGRNSFGRAIAVDAAGNAYVTGEFTDVSFPTTPGAFQTAGSGVAPFVTKMNPAGSALAYSTIVGSGNGGSGRGIALDSAGNAYVTGVVFTPDFPTLNPVQPSIAGSTFFRSSNAGGNWIPSPTGLQNREVLSLAIDPVTTSSLYAGTRGGGVFKSANGGNSWAAVNTGLPNATVNTLAISTSAVYAGTEVGAFKKKIGADNWDSINNGLTSSFVNALAIDPATPTTIYASTGGYLGGVSVPGGAFKSTDGGDTWGDISNGIFPAGQIVNSISIDPTNSSALYAGTSNGVFRSSNGGANWVKPSTILNNRNVYALAIDPVNTSTIYAGTYVSGPIGMYKSSDRGDSWTAITNGLGIVQIRSLAIDSANSATLYAGTVGSGPFKTTDGGSHWTFVGADVTGTVVGALAIDPTASSTVYAGTANRADAFLLKVDPTGSALVYSTFLGGSRAEMGSGVAVGSDGSAYVVGRTFSVDFPVANPLQPLPGLLPDGFVAKFTPGGSAFAYSTYLGGSDFDNAHGIALDPSGGAYVAGDTSSPDFPTTTGAFQPSSGGGFSDSFVAKISSCAFSLSSTSAAFPLTGGSGSVTINAPAGCSWTAVSNDSWVFITSADSGNGNATITFELRENFDERFRIGTLTIGGQTFTVFQEGLGSGGCSNAISPTFGSFPSIGGSGSVNVIANEECIWRSVSNTSWVTLTSNDNGIGVGVVTFSVGANAGTASRKGTITIAGQTFAVKQKGNVAASHGSGGGKP